MYIKGINKGYIQEFNENLIDQNIDVHQLIQEDRKHIPVRKANIKQKLLKFIAFRVWP